MADPAPSGRFFEHSASIATIRGRVPNPGSEGSGSGDLARGGSAATDPSRGGAEVAAAGAGAGAGVGVGAGVEDDAAAATRRRSGARAADSAGLMRAGESAGRMSGGGGGSVVAPGGGGTAVVSSVRTGFAVGSGDVTAPGMVPSSRDLEEGFGSGLAPLETGPGSSRPRGEGLSELKVDHVLDDEDATQPTPNHVHLKRVSLTDVRSADPSGVYGADGGAVLASTRNRSNPGRRGSAMSVLAMNPYDMPEGVVPEGHTAPWACDLTFHDPDMESAWKLLLLLRRQRVTFWLELAGAVVFLLLVLTDISIVLSVDDNVDRFTWWKVATRLITGAVALLVLGIEWVVEPLRKHHWQRVRAFNVLMCTVWSVVFAPTGGLAGLLDGAPFHASCTSGGVFSMQEVRIHPAALLLLFCGPVLEVQFMAVVVISVVTCATELALTLGADTYGTDLLIADHIGVSLMLVGVSAATAYANERSSRTMFLHNRRLHKENLQLNEALSKRNLDDGGTHKANIQSTSEKLLELLNSIKSRLGDDDELEEALTLMQAGEGMFAPDLTELDASELVDEPIKEWLLTGPARLADQRRTMRRKASSICTTGLIDKKVSVASLPTSNDSVQRFLSDANFDVYDFDILALADTSPHVLCLVAEAVLIKFDTCETFSIPPTILHKFLSRLDSGYVATNPYHNSTHAASVTWDMQYFLLAGRAERFFTRLEMFACIIAAACHDYEHPGRNNQFLINVMDDVAVTYNDVSVLENYHVAEAFKLGLSEPHPLLHCLEKEDLKRFRQVVVDMVLATDVSRHFKHVAKLKTKSLATPMGAAAAQRKVADIDMLTTSLIMMCDLGHAAKTFDLHQRWTLRVTEEFFQQGDAEKAAGMKVSPLCDRDTTRLAASQLGFYDYLVIPLFEAANGSHSLSRFQPILDQVHSNYKEWRNRKNRVDLESGYQRTFSRLASRSGTSSRKAPPLAARSGSARAVLGRSGRAKGSSKKSRSGAPQAPVGGTTTGTGTGTGAGARQQGRGRTKVAGLRLPGHQPDALDSARGDMGQLFPSARSSPPGLAAEAAAGASGTPGSDRGGSGRTGATSRMSRVTYASPDGSRDGGRRRAGSEGASDAELAMDELATEQDGLDAMRTRLSSYSFKVGLSVGTPPQSVASGADDHDGDGAGGGGGGGGGGDGPHGDANVISTLAAE